MPLTYEEREERKAALLSQYSRRLIGYATLRVSLGHLQLPATEIEEILKEAKDKNR